MPLCLTGKAVLTGGVYAPIDISFQTDPLQSLRERAGVGPPARAVLGDVVYQDIPWRKATRQAIKTLRLPIWNPYILGGEPLLAVMQSAVLHPFSWIGMLLPLDQAWTLEMSLGLLLALVSAFIFFSDLRISQSAAVLGAIGWAFCDYLRFYAGWALSPAAAVLPLMLLGVRRIVVGKHRNGALIFGSGLVLCVTAGHPETALHAVVGSGIWLLAELSVAPRGTRTRAVFTILLAGLAASGVMAVLLIPHLEALHHTWEYFLRSTWWVKQHKSTTLAESAVTLQQAIVPYVMGVAGHGTTRIGSQVPQAYLGSVLLPFAVIGLFARRHEKWACILLALVGFGAWCHFPGLADAVASLPLLDLALNERLVFLGCLAIALLAAIGVDLLIAERGLLWTIPLTAGLVLVIYRSNLPQLRSFEMPDEFRTQLLLMQLVPLALIAGVWLLPRQRRFPKRLLATVLILLAQRLAETWNVYPVAPRGSFYPHLNVLDPIRRGAPYRMAALGMAFVPNVSALYEVEDIRGYEAMTFLPLMETYPLWCVHQPVCFNRVDDPARPFLSFLNVKFILAAPGVATPIGWPVLSQTPGGNLVENPKVLERAFIPAETQVQPDAVARLAAMMDVSDFGRQGLINNLPSRAPGQWRPNGRGSLRISEYRGDYLRLDVEANEELVVGTSIPAWPGWISMVDNNRSAVLRYNHAFIGSAVPTGRHRLEFKYRPTSLVIGALVSFATLLCLSALGVLDVISTSRLLKRSSSC